MKNLSIKAVGTGLLLSSSVTLGATTAVSNTSTSSAVCSAVRLQAMQIAAEEGTNEVNQVSNPSFTSLMQCVNNINVPFLSLGIPNIMNALRNAACNFLQQTVGTEINKLNGQMSYINTQVYSATQIPNLPAGSSMTISPSQAAGQIWKNMGVQPTVPPNTIGDQSYPNSGNNLYSTP